MYFTLALTLAALFALAAVTTAAAGPRPVSRQGKKRPRAITSVPGVVPTIFGGSPADSSLTAKTAQLYMCSSAGCGFCTGSVVERTWVLTAAHCLRFNGQNVNSGTVTILGAEYAAVSVHIHRNFLRAEPTLADDVGLVAVAAPGFPSSVAEFSLTVSSATVPAPGTEVSVAGHGQTGPGSDVSATLMQGSATLLASSACGGYENLGFLCTDTLRSSGVVCPGDSGGPLFVADGESHRVVGVNSAVLVSTPPFECGDTNSLHIYADVSQSAGMISAITDPTCRRRCRRGWRNIYF